MELGEAISMVAQQIGVEPLDVRLTFTSCVNHRHKVPTRIANQQGTLAVIAMLSGNREQAAHCIDQAFNIAREVVSVDESTRLSEILPMRTVNALEKFGALNVGDLVKVSRFVLLTLPGFGETRVKWIENRLAEHGFELAR